jgi:hypothetical protein
MAAAYIAGLKYYMNDRRECYLRVFKIWCDVFFLLGCILKGFQRSNTLLDFFCYYWFLV